MGLEVCRTVIDAQDMKLIGAVDPGAVGQDIGTLCGREGDELAVEESLEAIENVDVVVDFSRIDASRNIITECAQRGLHAVVGTTGFTKAEAERASALFTNSNAVIAPNFAIGAVLMMRFAELAAPHFESAEIIELHHENKLDAPSGTAMMTAQRMAEASPDWLDDPTETEVLEGVRGGEGPAGIRIHSVRLNGLVAHQEVHLGTTGQTLQIRHDSYDRTSFMPGVALAVRSVSERPGVTFGLDALLGL